jgi:hypothetical protein
MGFFFFSGPFSPDFLDRGWGNNRREGPFSLLFFLFVQGADTKKRKITFATYTLENPYFDYMVFFKKN